MAGTEPRRAPPQAQRGPPRARVFPPTVAGAGGMRRNRHQRPDNVPAMDWCAAREGTEQHQDARADAPGLRTAVLNLDDAVGLQLAQRLAARGVRTIGYSLEASAIAPGSAAEFIAAHRITAQTLELRSSWGRATGTVNQLGRFNLSNALGVLGCLVAYGVPFQEAVELLGALPSVPGRMQKIGERPLVVVDYAHTPDALEKVLQALRPVAEARGGRLAAVFGAGGDRDVAKRPRMGAIAARLADHVIVTSDNPRSEDPLAIIAAVSAGIRGVAAPRGARGGGRLSPRRGGRAFGGLFFPRQGEAGGSGGRAAGPRPHRKRPPSRNHGGGPRPRAGRVSPPLARAVFPDA